MMPLRLVGIGFATARIGLLVAVAGGILALTGWVCAVQPFMTTLLPNERIKLAEIGRPFLLLGYGAVLFGEVVGFVGRCLCLPTPRAYPRARRLVRWGVLLEVIALLNLAATAGLVATAAAGWITLPPWVGPAGGGVSGLMGLVARVLFLRFGRRLADELDDRRAARGTTAALVFLGVLVGCGAFRVVLRFMPQTLDTALADSVVTLLGGVAFICWCVCTNGLLHRLAAACRDASQAEES